MKAIQEISDTLIVVFACSLALLGVNDILEERHWIGITELALGMAILQKRNVTASIDEISTAVVKVREGIFGRRKSDQYQVVKLDEEKEKEDAILRVSK